jgi:hypothetical protein
MSGLTEFQAEATPLFFSLPASNGFLLAGGGALLATGLTTRATQDLDFFGARDRVDMGAVRDQFEAAVVERGWRCERVQESDTFVRFRLSGTDEVQLCHPTGWTVLSPLASWVDEKHPQRYGAIAAGDKLGQVRYQINLVHDARRV